MTAQLNDNHSFTIWQQNLNKNLTSQLDLLHSLDPNKYDLAMLQEPYIDFLGRTQANPYWEVVYPTKHLENPKKTRSIILVNRRISTDTWMPILSDSGDLTGIKLTSNNTTMHLFNIYNDCAHSETLNALDRCLQQLRTQQHGNERTEDSMLWFGNFNWHHPMWDKERNRHLFTSANATAAAILIDLLGAYGMYMALPKDTPTLEAKATKNYT